MRATSRDLFEAPLPLVEAAFARQLRETGLRVVRIKTQDGGRRVSATGPVDLIHVEVRLRDDPRGGTEVRLAFTASRPSAGRPLDTARLFMLLANLLAGVVMRCNTRPMEV